MTSAVVTGLAVGTDGLLEQRADEGVRGELAGRSGDDLALRLSLPLAANASAQDAGVREVIETEFVRADLAISVDRSVQGRVILTRAEGQSDESGAQVLAVSVPDFEARADLVTGSWPDGSGFTMQADAAARLELAPGAIVQLGGVPFELTGTWRIRDAHDARWTNSRLVSEGATVQLSAVVVIAEADWARLDADRRAIWSVLPDIRYLSAADLSTIPNVWSRLSGPLRDEVGSLAELERSGRFARTAEEIKASVAGLGAVAPLALLLIGALALATLAQLARLLAIEREDETRLLWSRGASRGGIAGHAGLEALTVALAGAAIGTSITLGAVAASGTNRGFDTGILALPLPVPGAVVAGTAALFAAAIAWGFVRRLDLNRGERSRRRPGVRNVELLVLVGLAAAVTTWQLRLYDSPFTPTTSGELTVDPITVTAPALVLIAVVLAAVALAPVTGRLLDRPGRRASIGSLLAVRNVARRTEVVSASVTILAIAVATIVVAAGYSGSWSLAFDRTAQLRAGADMAASVDPPGLAVRTIDAIGALPEVSATAALHVETIQIAGGAVSLVAVSPDALRDMVAPLALPGVHEVAEGLRAEVPGPGLPSGTERLEIMVAVTGFLVAPTLGLQIADAYGVLRELELESSADWEPAGLITYSASIPQMLGNAQEPLQVLAVDVGIPNGAVAPGTDGGWEMQSIRAGGPSGTAELGLGGFWFPQSDDSTLALPLRSASGHGFEADSSARIVRMTPVMSSDALRPIAISTAFAARTRTGIGDMVTLRPAGGAQSVGAVVVKIVATVPSAGRDEAVLIDLGIIRNGQLMTAAPPAAPRLLWMSTGQPEAAAAAVRDLLPAGSRLADANESATRAALGAATIALWSSAIACAVLALITVAASARAQGRGRRGEVVILRALGVDARQQGAIRGTEFALMSTAAAGSGLAAGAAVVLATIGPFARSAVPAALPSAATPLAVDAIGGGAVLLALALGLGAIAMFTARRVTRDARSSGTAEQEQ